jgi:TetR/AcrR family transcriptional repressor of nem operon
MTRPRGFDEDAVLDAATARFWAHGYGATSMRDIGAATGLGAASLYNAFGDKHALFARCLDHYLDGTMRERIARLRRTHRPRAAIETFLDEIVARSLAGDRRGCLLINTALELGPHDAGIRATVAARLAELEAFFLHCIRSGQTDGSIHPGRSARDLARLLKATVMGLRVLARAAPEAATLKGVVRAALALLDPPTDGARV